MATIAPLDLTPVPEPAQIGPLSRVVIPAPEAAFHVGVTSDEPAGERVADNALPVEARPLIEDYPIERCAAITASIARRRAETAQILDENRLDPARWAELSQHWKEAITKETGRGTRLLGAGMDTPVLKALVANSSLRCLTGFLLFFLAFMVAFVWVLASGWVKAGRRGLQFRNGLRRHELEWSQVEGIRYGPGDAWAFVLVDSPVERLPLMGIMRTDGPRADDDVEQLRRLAATYAR